MSTTTSPTCYGVPAHVAVDVTPKPRPPIKNLDFYCDEPLRYLCEAEAYRDCSLLGKRGKRYQIGVDAQIHMRSYMRSAALRAVSAVRRRLANPT